MAWPECLQFNYTLGGFSSTPAANGAGVELLTEVVAADTASGGNLEHMWQAVVRELDSQEKSVSRYPNRQGNRPDGFSSPEGTQASLAGPNPHIPRAL